jgi:amidophosphoribosyltransferase
LSWDSPQLYTGIVYKNQQSTLHKEFILKINIMAGKEQLLNLDIEDKCGVTGVYSPEGGAPYISYIAQKKLQHRGQDGFGFAAHELGTQQQIVRYRNLGKIVVKGRSGQQIDGMFDEDARNFMPESNLANGHNWYSTSNGRGIDGVQPFIPEQSSTRLAVAHNGNFNERLLWQLAHEHGVDTTIRNGQIMSDSRVFTETLGKATERLGHIEPALHSILPSLEDSAFSLTVIADEGLYGIRDRNGIRPLHFGTIHNLGARLLSSEIGGLDATDATHDREVLPGTYIVINQHGEREERWGEQDLKSCLFELIYLSKPDNLINGTLVADYRRRAGAKLSQKAFEAGIPLKNSLIVPVLGSGKFYAEGAKEATGLDYATNALIKNEGVDRTFIAVDHETIMAALDAKFDANPDVVKDQDVVLYDDSAVRGNTTKKITEKLRKAGARKVFVLIGAPKNIDTCNYGVNVHTQEELIAYDETKETIRSDEEIAELINADKIIYLDLDEAYEAAGWSADNTCARCMGGNSPACSHNNKLLFAA